MVQGVREYLHLCQDVSPYRLPTPPVIPSYFRSTHSSSPWWERECAYRRFTLHDHTCRAGWATSCILNSIEKRRISVTVCRSRDMPNTEPASINNASCPLWPVHSETPPPLQRASSWLLPRSDHKVRTRYDSSVAYNAISLSPISCTTNRILNYT